ncbi:hypothetical protein ABBQ38_011321 [Trebouxia sp. C0009 RCD-2024]
MAGKTAADKSDTQVEEKPADQVEVPKKRGRPAKTAVDKASEKPKQAAPEPVKGTEAAQEGKRPRGRPPGTGKKQKAAAEAAAAKDATKNEAALEGEGTASTNEDAEEATEPAQKKGKKKAQKAPAS